MNRRGAILSLTALAGLAGTAYLVPPYRLKVAAQALLDPTPSSPDAGDVFRQPEPWAANLITAAEEQIGQTVLYDPAYVRLSFPNGDVPRERGVCTDVVIRAYRDAFDIDLQKLVNADMKGNFKAYPQKWGLKRPDRNIDHRRVPNLERFFTRRGASRKITADPQDYLPGDVVSQVLPGGQTHIVIVTHRATSDSKRPLVVHNIGAGTRLEDMLFEFNITGHFRFPPAAA